MTDSQTIGGTFFTNVHSTVQTLVIYIENSDISGKIFDMTNGGEFENKVLYVDNVNTRDSFFTASDTKVRSTSMAFNNNDINGDFFRVNGTFSSSMSVSRLIKLQVNLLMSCEALSATIGTSVISSFLLSSENCDFRIDDLSLTSSSIGDNMIISESAHTNLTTFNSITTNIISSMIDFTNSDFDVDNNEIGLDLLDVNFGNVDTTIVTVDGANVKGDLFRVIDMSFNNSDFDLKETNITR